MIPLTTAGDELRLLGPADLGQVRLVVHALVASRGQPWREAEERIAAIHKIPPARRARLAAAARRMLARPARGGLKARLVRARVLGHPALTADARAARIAAAATDLGVSTDAVERALWSDLLQERLVDLPAGDSPEDVLDPRALAALANQGVLEAALRKAFAVSLRLWGTSRLPLKKYGLQSRRIVEGDATRFEIRGPLSVLQKTTIYGRALASALLPVLIAHERFALTIRFDQYGEREVLVEPPLLV